MTDQPHAAPPGPRRIARPLLAVAWTIAALTVLDFAVGKQFRMPANPKVQPSSLQAYFDYGRSAAGKLRAMVKPSDEQSAPIVVAGWIDRECVRTARAPAGALGISLFGNSFAGQLSEALARSDPALYINLYGGPGAPPSHSYACFVKENESGRDRLPVQIIGITASSLPRMGSIWGATTSVEYPQPFTFPRYSVGAHGELLAHEPSVRSPNDLRRILSDSNAWNGWLAELDSEDYFFSRILTSEDPADHSVIGRMIRRGFGQYIIRRRMDELHAQDTNFAAPEISRVLPALMSDFAQRARQAGELPMVVMFDEYGYSGVLERILEPTLIAERIAYVSSPRVVPANDVRNYQPDRHFTAQANDKLAQAVLEILQSRFPRGRVESADTGPRSQAPSVLR